MMDPVLPPDQLPDSVPETERRTDNMLLLQEKRNRRNGPKRTKLVLNSEQKFQLKFVEMFL